MIKCFDIFAGIGRFRSGLERVGGFEFVGSCEINKYARCAYMALYDTGKEVYFEDARDIKPKKLLSDAYRGEKETESIPLKE